MSHTTEPIPGVHPFISPLLTCCFILFAKVASGVPPHEWHIPAWLMEGSQLVAWWCVPGTLAIAVLNYLGIKINPFKKRKGKAK